MSEDPLEIALWMMGLTGWHSIDAELAQLLDGVLRLFAPRASA